MTDLTSTVALVAGASRGVGRGVALALAERGATVYVTGRTLKSARRRDRPGSIDETADAASRLAGRGIAVQTDHTRVEDVRALAETVRQHHGRLDVLVHAIGAGAAGAEGPVWEQPLARWDATVRARVWPALLTSRFLTPQMLGAPGLVVTLTGDPHDAPSAVESLAWAALAGLAEGMARDLKPFGATSVALVPGLVRTEAVLATHDTTERRWDRVPALAASRSPREVGDAVAALAADPTRLTRTGQTLRVEDLGR